MNIKIKRTFEIKLTPQEIAQVFCDMEAVEQAQFFSDIFKITRTWKSSPSSGPFYNQSCWIIEEADDGAREIISTLASHIIKD
jgi:hypothetical protein